MNKRKLLAKIAAGSHNIAFHDMVALVEAFGFRESRVKGSHHVFTHRDIPELVNLQQDLSERLGLKVEIRQNSHGRGRLVLHFASHDELNDLVARLA